MPVYLHPLSRRQINGHGGRNVSAVRVVHQSGISLFNVFRLAREGPKKGLVRLHGNVIAARQHLSHSEAPVFCGKIDRFVPLLAAIGYEKLNHSHRSPFNGFAINIFYSPENHGFRYQFESDGTKMRANCKLRENIPMPAPSGCIVVEPRLPDSYDGVRWRHG